MASVLLMVGGAILNALAFSGSSYLFAQIGHDDAQKEQKRHDAAVEALQSAQALWAKRRVERLDWLNEQLQREGHAVRSFQDVDQAMQEYRIVSGGKQLSPLEPEPTLSDFYTPSETQKDRELTFIVLGMAVTGFVAYKLR